MPLALALALALYPSVGSAQTETEIADLAEGAQAEVAYTNVQLPVDIALDADGTLYYASFESGELRQVSGGADTVLWTAPNLQLGGERGFVGLAERDGTFWVYYQTNKSGNVVSRFSSISDGVETVLLDDIRSGKLHNSGRIAFHPDGTILLSVGDAVLDTVGRQASMHAHDPQDLNGKVLRLNPDGTIPGDNPWGNAVWTKGHRNVYGLAVSPAGIVLATENGPESWDEVNILEAGKDYGWPTCSGICGDARFVDPTFTWEDTIAPTGAVWYEGAFYFTDFNKGSVHRARELANGSWVDERILKFTTPRILDIATGPDGLYVSTWDSVWRLTPPALPAGTVSPSPEPEPEPEGEPTPPAGSPSPTGSHEPPAEGAIGQGKSGIPAPGLVATLVCLLGVAAILRGREFK